MDYENFCEDILESLKWAKEDLIKNGLWTEQITFEDLAKHAGQNIQLTEQETE